MAACDVFVLNSSYEGFPHVILEAMCAGLPVIATAVGGTPEVVRNDENGMLIAPMAGNLLAETLLSLLSSSDDRERLAIGAQQTVNRFRQSTMVQETDAVLQNVYRSTLEASGDARSTS
jgi:glycosyltransferase involved in cell wall biosynthesis